MAGTIPPALKSTDVARFALRAGQLEKAKPVVAYWCRSLSPTSCHTVWTEFYIGYYWIIDQVIAKGLHKSSNESMTYTTNLMDKLEQVRWKGCDFQSISMRLMTDQMKADYAENDAITDDMAGHAYIEQFGLETFQRAENAMKANKASRCLSKLPDTKSILIMEIYTDRRQTPSRPQQPFSTWSRSGVNWNQRLPPKLNSPNIMRCE